MHALVTGGGGFLGLAIVEQLIARGARVRVLCRGNYPRLLELGVEVIAGDVRDRAIADKACRDVDTVFHVAAVSGIWGTWDYFYGINTRGTENIIAGCQNHSVCRLIYTSSPSVVYDGSDHENADESLPYPTKYLCHYPHTKALAEQAVLRANSPSLATVALRPHLIWGPGDNHLIPRLIARAQKGQLVRVGTGKNRVSIVFVENAAHAHIAAAELLSPNAPHAGRPYFINDPEPVLLWDWIDQLLELAKLPPVRRQISSRTAYIAGSVLEGVYRLLRIHSEPRMTRFLACQLAGSHFYSIAAAQRDCGYSPPVSFTEGMQRLLPDLRRLSSPTEK